MTTIIAIVIWEGMTALDVLGPHEILATWPKAQIHTVATQADPIRAASGLVLTPSRTIEQLPSPDVVLVGGGADAYRPMTDPALLN